MPPARSRATLTDPSELPATFVVIVPHRADRHALVLGLQTLRRVGDASVGNDLARFDATSASALKASDWTLRESRCNPITAVAHSVRPDPSARTYAIKQVP
ncbi:MAG: hypothetical protein OXC19_00185 [Bryobacterales bacterium]|nr:hypothetical protein [Bryobacterales bacterium]